METQVSNIFLSRQNQQKRSLWVVATQLSWAGRSAINLLSTQLKNLMLFTNLQFFPL